MGWILQFVSFYLFFFIKKKIQNKKTANWFSRSSIQMNNKKSKRQEKREKRRKKRLEKKSHYAREIGIVQKMLIELKKKKIIQRKKHLDDIKKQIPSNFMGEIYLPETVVHTTRSLFNDSDSSLDVDCGITIERNERNEYKIVTDVCRSLLVPEEKYGFFMVVK